MDDPSASVVAALLTASVALLVGLVTVAQKWRSEAREAWWARAQWAIDKSLSADPVEREIGGDTMGVLGAHSDFGVTDADVRVLEIALLRAMVDTAASTRSGLEQPAAESRSASGNSGELDLSARALPRIPTDAYRVGDNIVVQFDLPGANCESIDLSVEGNELTVSAGRSVPQLENAEWIVSERPYGTFTRQLALGSDLDAIRHEALYRDGVLTVSIQMAEKGKPRKIVVAPSARDEDQRAGTTEDAEDLDTVTPPVAATAVRHLPDPVERAQRSAARALVAVKDRLGEPVDAEAIERAGMAVDERRTSRRRPSSRLGRGGRGN
ncbi:Hsp20/alpha crystallin family protein [Geodermatophilus sp. SYSU D00079]